MLNSQRVYATGKRKSAVARVWIQSGSGRVLVNKKLIAEYFPLNVHELVYRAFTVTGTSEKFDVMCTVRGGGVSGQAGAVSNGISKALNIHSSDFHAILRKNGLLTRDSRIVERKKYGRRKARKKTQFSKR